jgi:hypothetical protein
MERLVRCRPGQLPHAVVVSIPRPGEGSVDYPAFSFHTFAVEAVFPQHEHDKTDGTDFHSRLG